MIVLSLPLYSVLLIAVSGFGLVTALWLTALGQRTARRRVLANSRQQLALTTALSAYQQRIEMLEETLRKVVRRVETVDHQRPTEVLYSRAISLAAKGAAPDALGQSCGLTEGEAGLISGFYGRERA